MISLAFIVLMLPPEPTRADVGFMFAQERFVHEAAPTFTPPCIALIEKAGSPRYKLRENASRQLMNVELRWVMWGVLSPDLETRIRCHVVLRKRTRCRSCNGGVCIRGELVSWEPCPACGKSYYDHPNHCPPCNDKGSLWSHPMFGE